MVRIINALERRKDIMKSSFLIILLWALPSLCMERTISLSDYIEALRQGNTEVIQSWIAMAKSGKVDVNAKDPLGWTVLMLAASSNRWGAIKELLKAPNIELNAKDNKGRTALMLAIFDEDENAARLLWAVGARDPEIALNPKLQKAKDEGLAALKGIITALRSGDEEALRKYQDQGFSIMIRDTKGNGPLHQAIIGNQPKLAKNLVKENELLLKQQNNDGITPLELLFGMWGDEHEDWNKFIAELPAEFNPDIVTAKGNWQASNQATFNAGIAGMKVTQ
jgi:ankyrin repeat protein